MDRTAAGQRTIWPCAEKSLKGRGDMNKHQQIVLIVGAIALLIVVFTTPKYLLQAGILRALAVIGGTLLITYVLKDKNK